MCLHQDAIYPSAVELPQMRVAYSLNAQLMWLKQEAAELCQVRQIYSAVAVQLIPTGCVAFLWRKHGMLDCPKRLHCDSSGPCL